MIDVQSLNRRFALQFAAVLLPLVALLAYVTHAEWRRATAMNQAFAIHATAIETRELYAQFLNGAVDSVDTGRLSQRARTALAGTNALVEKLIALEPDEAALHAQLSNRVESQVSDVKFEPRGWRARSGRS